MRIRNNTLLQEAYEAGYYRALSEQHQYVPGQVASDYFGPAQLGWLDSRLAQIRRQGNVDGGKRTDEQMRRSAEFVRQKEENRRKYLSRLLRTGEITQEQYEILLQRLEYWLRYGVSRELQKWMETH